MKPFRRNRKGQFTIIAAVLVSVILVATVISTYAAIRYNPLQEQPQILSSIDEINLALKQVLGFTVGYYGSVLQVTGNTTYARQLATSYLQSGLVNIGDVRPEWAPSFDITTLDLHANWYSNNSFSSGNLSVTYDLPGIGISGVTYSVSSRLDVQVSPSIGNQAVINVMKDGIEPLVNVPKQNLKFYRYVSSDMTWEQVSPSSAPFIYANGTYYVDLPSGVPAESYFIKVEDSRGIVVIASSFNSYTGTLIRNSTYTGADFVDNNISNVDSIDNIGSHSNFPAQQSLDSNYDTLKEMPIGTSTSNTLLNEPFEGGSFTSNWDSHQYWDIANNGGYGGGKSAIFNNNGRTGSLITKDLNCSDASLIIIDFWYMDSGCESNEFYLNYYNGARDRWDTQFSLANQTSPENQWINFQYLI